jgi:hypothetical protein
MNRTSMLAIVSVASLCLGASVATSSHAQMTPQQRAQAEAAARARASRPAPQPRPMQPRPQMPQQRPGGGFQRQGNVGVRGSNPAFHQQRQYSQRGWFEGHRAAFAAFIANGIPDGADAWTIHAVNNIAVGQGTDPDPYVALQLALDDCNNNSENTDPNDDPNDICYSPDFPN